jgi:vitamin B12 transporter
MVKHTLSLVASATLFASLEANTLTLNPIVVSATKTEQSLQNTTANIEIITAKEIEDKHYTTIAEALNSLSGVSVTSNGGFGKSTSVFLRGFDSKRALVLIDGIRYNDVSNSQDGASFEHLMLSDVEQIEVIKGAQSGVWGSEASAGVINIITKKAQMGTILTASLGYGSFDTRKYGASLAHKSDSYDFRLGVNRINTDGFTSYARRYTDINDYEDDGYKNTTINLNGGYRFDDYNTLRISHTDINLYTEYDSTTKDSEASYDKREKLSQISFENKNNIALTKFYTNRSTFARDYSTGSEFDGKVNEYGVSAELPYSENDFILIGGDYKSFEHLNQLNKKYTAKGIFLTNHNQFWQNLILTESIRSDNYDAFDDKTTGKIGMKYNFGSDTYLASNYGTAYNVPTLYQLYDGTYGNSTLKSEDTKSYDVTFGYHGVTLTYFSSRVKEMIDYDFTTSKYNNIDGTSTFKGFEAGYKNEVYEGTLVSLSYTRLSAKNKNGEDLRRRANETLKFGIDYYGFSKFHFGLNGEYVGSRYDNDNKQGAQTGRYTVANAVVNYDFSKNIKIYGKIDNITDKYYQSVNNYASSPRAYYAGMEVSF